MYIGGSWVSLQMADTIFILWAVAGAVLVVAVWWLTRQRPTKRPDKEAITRRRQGKRQKR
jgi:hypothetical protein